MRRLALAFVIAAACGGAPPPEQPRPDHCDATVLGACVVSDVALDVAHVERALRLGLDYWSAPDDALQGWAIELTTGPVTCNGAPASGCTSLDGSRVVRAQLLDPACLETAQLVHELGHVLHGDPGHTGPWWSWTGEQTQTWREVRSPGASAGCAASRFYLRKP